MGTTRFGPQNYGQPVQLQLAPATPVFGTVSEGNLVPILKLERDDDQAEPVDITLSIPQTVGFNLGFPISELVAVLTYGQGRAFSDGKSPTAGGGVIRTEIDWIHGAVVTVGGSSVQLWARWDNWSIAGFVNPGVRDVQAFLSTHGSRANPGPMLTRTQLHPNDLNKALTAVHRPPGFARSVQCLSPAGTSFAVRAWSHNGFVLGEMTFVSGTVSPVLRLPSGTGFIAVTNVGAANSPYSLVYELSL